MQGLNMRISTTGDLIMPINDRDEAHVGRAFFWPDMPGQELWAETCIWELRISDYRGGK